MVNYKGRGGMTLLAEKIITDTATTVTMANLSIDLDEYAMVEIIIQYAVNGALTVTWELNNESTNETCLGTEMVGSANNLINTTTLYMGSPTSAGTGGFAVIRLVRSEDSSAIIYTLDGNHSISDGRMVFGGRSLHTSTDTITQFEINVSTSSFGAGKIKIFGIR